MLSISNKIVKCNYSDCSMLLLSYFGMR